jgi:hypothetical protein
MISSTHIYSLFFYTFVFEKYVYQQGSFVKLVCGSVYAASCETCALSGFFVQPEAAKSAASGDA